MTKICKSRISKTSIHGHEVDQTPYGDVSHGLGVTRYGVPELGMSTTLEGSPSIPTWGTEYVALNIQPAIALGEGDG